MARVRKIDVSQELRRAERCINAGKAPCAVCQGFLLPLCFTPMRHYLELMKEQDSQAPDVAFLEALYRLEDPRC